MAPETCLGAESGWGCPTQKVTWHLNCVVNWKIKNIIGLQLQGGRDVKGKLVLAKNKHKNAN